MITAYWISDKFQNYHIVLDFLYFPPPHNARATAELLLCTIKQYKIADKVAEITTVSGSEMKGAAQIVRASINELRESKIGEHWHVRCVCHVIDRAVKSGMVQIDEMVSKLHRLLKTIRMSPRICAKYA